MTAPMTAKTSYRDVPVDVDAILDDISRVTAIESPTSSPAGVNAVLDLIASWFDGTGASLERARIADNLGDMLKVRSAQTGGANSGILVLSHVDTVHPIGTLGGPLPLRREGDRLYGPGVYDMKGGLTLAVAAFRRLAAARATTPLPITFMFTPDEEVSSPASRAHIEEEAARHKYVLVTEPKRDGGQVVTSRKGVGRFVIETHGRPAHSGGAHDKGRSAIVAMASIIQDIAGFTDYARGITTNVGLVSGGTGVNVIPEHCRINADMRITDMASAKEVEARFHALKSPDPDVQLKITGGLTRPPYERGPHIDVLFDKAAAVAEMLGFTLKSGPRTGGGSDGNFTAMMGLPTLDGLGVDGDGAHTHEEHLLVSSIEPGTRLMQGLFETLV
jgi:glutamate carboxypeptidase